MSKHLLRVGLVLSAFLVVCVLVGVGAMFFAELPPAPEHARVAPVFRAPPPAFSMCWVEFSRSEVWGELGAAGFVEAPRWQNTASGLLIRHPKGSLLIDAGYSSHALEELSEVPGLRRLFSSTALDGITWRISAPEALQRVGVTPETLRWLLPSHGHLDHLGGAVDLPGVGVLLTEAERAALSDHRVVVPAHGRAIQDRVAPIVFEAKPYETFDESLDFFGDGSVVIVPLSGHTPGSVGVFVNLGPTKRLLHVGDTVNLEESITRRVPKSALLRWFTDSDQDAASLQVARLSQLHELVPELQIVPAHDRSVYERFFGGEPGCINAE